MTCVIVRGPASRSERWIGLERRVRKLRSLLWRRPPSCASYQPAPEKILPGNTRENLTRQHQRKRLVWKEVIGWLLRLGCTAQIYFRWTKWTVVNLTLFSSWSSISYIQTNRSHRKWKGSDKSDIWPPCSLQKMRWDIWKIFISDLEFNIPINRGCFSKANIIAFKQIFLHQFCLWKITPSLFCLFMLICVLISKEL